MDDLRSEIRAAFEKDQTAHPPSGGLRGNVVAAAATQSRPAPNLQWIAIAVAAVLGILVVAGLMSTRLGPRANLPGNHKATSARLSTPTPSVDYGPPPAGVPLLYVHDPNNPSWLIGFDWSGQPRGTVKLSPEAAQGGVRMAPDGSKFQVGSTIKGGTDIFLDRLGHPIPANGVSTDVAGEMWADDNKHLCLVTLNQQTFAWGLSTRLPGVAARPVAVIARDPGLGQSGISLAACSFDNNRAILVRTVIAWPSELWVVRLTDGKVLSHNTYSSSRPFANVVGSGDALFVAENSSKSVGQLGPAAPSTIIRRVSDRSVVATLDPSLAVLAFNGDDSLVLVTSSPSLEPAKPALMSVIDLRSGRAVWHDEGTSVFGGIAAQPGGRDFALILNTSGSQTPGVPDPMATILIIHGDGSVTKFPRLYEPTW